MTENTTAPTLEDVAHAAGVSTATVSRCLNFPERVGEATRARVMQVINELGYTPNFGARVMAAKRTFTIGAIIPTMENAIFARGLQAFQEALHEKGYTLLVASSAYKPDVEEEQIRALVSRGADGLLLIGHERSEKVTAYLRQQGVPTLVAWTFTPDASAPSVGFDNRASMRALTEEVLKFGHRRIGVISGYTSGNDRALQRVEGIREAVSANGLAPANLNIVETNYGIDSGGKAFEELMALKPRPTAVMCGNDVLAIGAIRRARKLGLKVPKDVSVTGFDDIELARITVPELTTVHVPHRKMGRKAAEELVDMVEKRSTGVSIELATSLEIRGSLGPARGN